MTGYRWTGRYYKGALRDRRDVRHEEAEMRNWETPYERTAEYRRRLWALADVDLVSQPVRRPERKSA